MRTSESIPLLIHTGLITLVLVAICILRMTGNVSQPFIEQILTMITSTVLGGGAVSVGTRIGGKSNDKAASKDETGTGSGSGSATD